MRRSDFYIKLTTAVLFLAVVSYIGVYIYNAARNTYLTAPAVRYTIEETAPARGYIVREETVLAAASGSVLPVVAEGEKVARNQLVAIGYRNGEALQSAGELRELKMKINQLEEAEAHSPASAAALASESLLALSRAVHTGSLGGLEELTLRVESYVFAGGAAPETELPALRDRLNRLESQNTGTHSVLAPVSGVFSSVTDGYENINPDMLDGLTPTKLENLFAGGGGGGTAAGKLVAGIEWYYAAVMDSSDAGRLSPSQSVKLQFTSPYRVYLQMKVEYIGRNEEGSCVVLLSSSRNLAETAALREVQAEVVFGELEGIRVPREAIHLGDDGRTFVYLETAGRSEAVDVTIIGELGDGYIVESPVEANTALRPGALVIVKANGLTGGKVVPR